MLCRRLTSLFGCRWSGIMDLYIYYSVSQKGIQRYDIKRQTEAANACPNPDGSTYGDHQLNIHEWLIVHQVVSLSLSTTTKLITRLLAPSRPLYV